ncbi:MAG: CatB-related O-acetyltransferase [Nitrospirota bacterium]
MSLFKRNRQQKEETNKKNSIYTKDIFEGSESVIAGDFSYGSPKVMEWKDGHTRLVIGKFCSISSDVVIILGGNHRTDWVTTYPFPALAQDWPGASEIKGHPATKGDIIIGNDVWICYGATILSGVVIGDGAVIGARSVVSDAVAPYSIVAGNPAREIRKRFDDATIKMLLELKWWDWPLDRIKKNMHILCGCDFEHLFKTNEG